MIDANKPLDPTSEQYQWLDRALARSDATWKLCVQHQPAWTSDENDYGDTWTGASTWGDPNVRHLTALFDRHNVDIDFNGHIHVYERSWPLRAGAVERDGTVYVTTGGGGGSLENFAPTKPWFSNHVMRGHHFGYVTVQGDRLDFQAFDLEGRLFDAFTLEK